MLSAADVKVGEVLLDPMCGTGMLLTEAPNGCQLLGISVSSVLHGATGTQMPGETHNTMVGEEVKGSCGGSCCGCCGQ